ncbi:glycosyltransferase family 4 protein [Silvibacterium dinghuense]|uniref:glycosyltransferase family 4 protein n=1 Tax=Silvibacterium dinghuense TaxID=1560006 RepID=UPI00195838C9|nr:glycosyltransferase family 4 protein [Silvibacterium dinghuense]GGH09234.1 glycosyl transferase [Silvibacterium dinghuense]
MRTLQLGNDWFGERQGGLNRVYSELLRHLPGANVEVRGLVAGSPGVAASTGGVVTGFAPAKAPLPKRLWEARKAGLHELKSGHFDLVASHFALYTLPIVDALKRTPTVIHFHGPWAAEAGVEGQSSLGSRVQAAMERAVYQRGRRLIVLSEAFAHELVRRYRVPENLVRLVPGGIDSDRFHDRLTRAETRERLGWPIDRPTVLAVRRQVRRMGLENLIDATLQVRKHVPEIMIMLAGSGPIMGELRERITSAGLENHIRQLGRVEDADLPTAYRAADLSIVPTQALEGFGMITLESLACGTPVLVSPVGGLPEVIRPFDPRCVLADASTNTIAESLTSFLTGAEKLPSSDACRAYAVKNFDWPVIAAKTRAVYEEALV